MLEKVRMSKHGHIPIRMCIGCRSRKKKEEMLRFIHTVDGIALFNKNSETNGRGFYLCPDVTCLKMAQKKGRGSMAWGAKDLLTPFMKELGIREERE
jgi:predicted RNA-binding protein YlxR (DUF448 family)